MANYLKTKGIIKHALFGIRIDKVFIQYYYESKKEIGHCGVWLWLAVILFFLGIVVGFCKDIFIEVDSNCKGTA